MLLLVYKTNFLNLKTDFQILQIYKKTVLKIDKSCHCYESCRTYNFFVLSTEEGGEFFTCKESRNCCNVGAVHRTE